MRKRFRSGSISNKLLKERMKAEQEKAEAEEKEKPKVDLDEVRKKARGLEIPTTVLSKHEYASHKKARDLMAAAVGSSSERLHLKLIDEKEFARVQEEAAKRSIRETNLYIARRAYLELTMHHLLTIPGRNVNGIPIKFQPLVDYWHSFWGCPHMIVDEVPKPPEEKKPKAKRKRPVRVRKEMKDEPEASEEAKS